jgi:hypothetical protein
MATGRVPTTANSPLTAKGDLFTYSTAPARLAVGNNGEQIVADSSATTGLRYQATPSASNPVINSAMQNWQRGTTFTSVANVAYTADRWCAFTNAITGRDVSRQVTGDTTNLPNIQYALRMGRASGNTNTTNLFIGQSFENVNSIPFAGKTVTLSYYARAGANYSSASSVFNVYMAYGTGTDQNIFAGFTGQTSTGATNGTLTTTWQRFTTTVSIASTATQLGFYFGYTPVGTAGAADYFEITGVQIDIGNVALPFRTYAATIQEELAACQRYYYKHTAGDNSNISMGSQYSSTELQTIVDFAVTMRTNPSAVIASGTDFYRFYRNSTFDSFNNLTRDATFSGAGAVNSIKLYNNTEISGTAGHAGIILTANASCSIAFDAEL